MTFSARWGDEPHEIKRASLTRTRQSSLALYLKSALFALAIAAMLVGLIAVRVFAYMPAVH